MPDAPETSASPPSFLAAIDRVLYPSTVGCTLVIAGFEVWEFVQGGRYRPPYPFADVYLTVLTAYSAQRELAKWKGEDVTTIRLRRGELYVAFWIAAWLGMTGISNILPRFTLPMELKTITLGVLAIFAGTGVSAGLRRRAVTRKAAADPDLRAQCLRVLREKGTMNAEEVGIVLNISKTTAWRTLEALEKDGRVVQESSANSRERRYRCS